MRGPKHPAGRGRFRDPREEADRSRRPRGSPPFARHGRSSDARTEAVGEEVAAAPRGTRADPFVMTGPGRSIGRCQQHQKQRAVGLVPGGDPAAFRSLHDGAAFGRAEVPPTGPTAFSQADFKKRKLLRHRIVCLCFAAPVQLFMKKVLKAQTIGNSFPPSELGFLGQFQRMRVSGNRKRPPQPQLQTLNQSPVRERVPAPAPF
jgi:hypothetical protein